MIRRASLILLTIILVFSGCANSKGIPADAQSSTGADAEASVAAEAVEEAKKNVGEAKNTPAESEKGTKEAKNTPAESEKDAEETEARTEEVAKIMRSRTYPDNTYKKLQRDFLKESSIARGTVEKFTYETKDHVGGGSTVYEKYSLVYLPAGYDKNDTETRYPVLYFMHGGSDSPEWFLKGEGQGSDFSYLFDYMIANGEMKPAIICFVSYYTKYRSNATKNCIYFHHELVNDLMPAFESKYHTYAKDTTNEAFKASRLYRAFGGFSMGAVTTWATFENRLDYIAYFLPVSGDCWALGDTAGGSRPKETAQHLADSVKSSGYTAADFCIYTGCGGNDIAKPNLEPQAAAMAKLSDTFISCDNFKDGNFYYCLYPEGGHNRNTVLSILYNALPKMFE